MKIRHVIMVGTFYAGRMPALPGAAGGLAINNTLKIKEEPEFVHFAQA